MKRTMIYLAPQSQSLQGEDPLPFGQTPPPFPGLVPNVAPEFVFVGDTGGVPEEEFLLSLSEESMLVTWFNLQE